MSYTEPRSAGSLRTEQILSAFHEEAALAKSHDARLLLKLWRFVRPHRALLYLGLAVIGLGACAALMRPLIMQHTIDQGVMRQDRELLMQGGFMLAAIVAFEQLLSFAQIYAMQIVGARAVADMRRHVFEFLHGLKIGFFDRQPVGRLVTRVTNDTDAILELFASGALNAIGDLVRLVGIVVLMIALDWKLALIGFAASPLVAVLVVLVRKKAREAFREIRGKTARMNATMNEQVSGMAVVQAFGREAAAAREFDDINVAYREANLRSIKYEALQDAAIETVAAVCLASIVMSLGYRPVSFGTLVAFNAYLVQFFEPISALAQRYTLLQSALAGAERVFGLLDVVDPDAPAGPTSPAKSDRAALEFEQVTFGYKPGVPVLTDVSFAAKPGEKIALVGPTGSGKSTIAALLLRLYEVESGTVRVDGQDTRGLSRIELRSRFSVVPQDVFLFRGTVADNIAAGELPDLGRVERALRRIDALDLFLRREGGLTAPIEEQGSNFSAGERQLIAFARALYRDAPILILDEATANVDSDTESRLQRALAELLKNRTALVIAHRLSTIRSMDRIIVLQKGRVVEQGRHQELLAQGGLYAKLHDLQFTRTSLAPEALTAGN